MSALPAGLSPEFLEPILKAELSKHSFLNLGGFLLGFALDAALFGMMLVMLGYWLNYVPRERLHVKLILVSREGHVKGEFPGRCVGLTD